MFAHNSPLPDHLASLRPGSFLISARKRLAYPCQKGSQCNIAKQRSLPPHCQVWKQLKAHKREIRPKIAYQNPMVKLWNMVNSILASSSFTPKGTSNGKISTAVKECPQKVPNGLSWRFYFSWFNTYFNYVESLSLSTHLGIYCTEMKSIQPRNNRKEITRTNKGQNGKYSKNVLCVKRTDACAASAVSRTISAMTLVPPTMANLCRNGHVFPTFEWRKTNTMEDLGLLWMVPFIQFKGFMHNDTRCI